MNTKKVIIAIIILLLAVGRAYMAFAWDNTLKWNPNTESDLQGYRLYRAPVDTCPDPKSLRFDQDDVVVTELGNVTEVVDGVPDSQAGAAYVLTAFDKTDNESDYSNCVARPKPITLTAVTNFRYEDGIMKWDGVKDAVGYLLRVHEQKTPYDPCSSMAVCTPNNNAIKTTSFSLVALTKPGKMYDAWIHPVGKAGEVGPSAGTMFTVEIIDVDEPAVPTGFGFKSPVSMIPGPPPVDFTPVSAHPTSGNAVRVQVEPAERELTALDATRGECNSHTEETIENGVRYYDIVCQH